MFTSININKPLYVLTNYKALQTDWILTNEILDSSSLNTYMIGLYNVNTLPHRKSIGDYSTPAIIHFHPSIERVKKAFYQYNTYLHGVRAR